MHVMGHRNREIEVKLIIKGFTSLEALKNRLDDELTDFNPARRFGSSVDSYWPIYDRRMSADFLRVRERDGIRQITVKGKDRGCNFNRIEIDIDSTSPTSTIHKMAEALLGKSAGFVTKTYWVWELTSEYETVSAYEVESKAGDFLYDSLVLEVEGKTEERVRELELKLVTALKKDANITVETAPGSLFEICILKKWSRK